MKRLPGGVAEQPAADESIAAKAVTISFARPDIGIEPIEADVHSAGEGQWAFEGLAGPAPGSGSWRCRSASWISSPSGRVEASPSPRDRAYCFRSALGSSR